MLKFFCSSILVLLLVGTSLSQSNSNVSGVWSDCQGEAFSNCTAVFSQKGDSIFVTHYIEWNGQPMVEHGWGTRQGNVLTYHVWVTVQIPGWSTQGDHYLTLSEDGNTLEGVYKDNKGNSGPLKFERSFLRSE